MVQDGAPVRRGSSSQIEQLPEPLARLRGQIYSYNWPNIPTITTQTTVRLIAVKKIIINRFSRVNGAVSRHVSVN